MKFFFPFFFLLILNTGSAQIEDSVVAALNKKPKPTFKIDSRNSFIADKHTSIVGLKAGADFGKTLRVGIGYHWLKTNVYKDFIHVNSSGLPDTTRGELKLNYLAYYAEQVFYRKNNWEFAVQFQFGIGNSRYKYFYEGRKIIKDKRLVLIYEPAISGHYKIFKWLGVGGDVGFRLMLKNNQAIKENFNSPTYALRVIVWFPELYKVIFQRD